jgi:hypothetical protein
LTWQHTRGSALIGFVEDDAEFIAEKIAEQEQSTVRADATTSVGADTATEVHSTERS